MDVRQLKDDIFDANHPERQYRAVYQMRYIGNDPEVVHILFRACYEARNPRLQQEAVRSLGVLKPERALEAFIKSTYSPNAEKRLRAYYHLGTLGNPKGIDAVLNGLVDSDESVRRAAAISAGRLGSDMRVIHSLKKLLNVFEPSSVQAEAKRSIDFIQKRMDGKSINWNRRMQQSFNKTDIPRSYTPKAF